MNGGELVVRCLEAEGVEYAFGIPGEELKDVMLPLEGADVRFVPVRHEQGAAFMADVYGRLTGDAGVCVSTLGPGATNLLTGVADATLDGAPVVAITGQGARTDRHHESHQRIPIGDVFAPAVKWTAELDDPDLVPEGVRKAFAVAEREKPGAAHVEIPEDVAAAAASADADPLSVRDPHHRSLPDPAALDRAIELLAGADRPVVLAGNGTVRTGAADALRAFVDATGVPVVGTYMAKGAISDRSDESLLTLGAGPDGEATAAIREADVVLAAGYDLAEHDPATWNPDGEATVIHLDREPAEVYARYDPAVEVVADVARGLDRLAEALDRSWPAWYADYREAIVGDAFADPDPDDPLSVSGTLPYLRETMADGDVLVSDVGSHKLAIAEGYPTYEPGACVVSNGFASMGIAVPGAVAADLAVEGNVVAATGDGGFLMNAAELNTAARLGCEFTVVLFNDDEYRLIREEFWDEREGTHGTALTNPDFESFGASFGAETYRASSWGAVADALADAIPSDGLSLVEVRLA